MSIRRVRLEESELLLACERGDATFLRQFVNNHRQREDFAFVDRQYFGPLHYAVASHSYECVEILLSTGHIHPSPGPRRAQPSRMTALDIAIRFKHRDRSATTHDIIRLLLQNDPTFYLIRNSSYFLRRPRVDLDVMRTIVDTLQTMNFQFTNEFGLLGAVLRGLRFDNDADALETEKFYDKVDSLVCSQGADMQQLCESLMSHHETKLVEWCIKKYHLTEGNEHRELVRKLLDNPSFGFDAYLLFGLHSGIRHLYEESTQNADIRFYDNIIKALLNVNTANRDVVNEFADILWPKLKIEWFTRAFQTALKKDRTKQAIADKMTSIDWLNTLKIGDKIEISLMEFDGLAYAQTVLTALMPFSTQATADVYLEHIQHELRRPKIMPPTYMSDDSIFGRLSGSMNIANSRSGSENPIDSSESSELKQKYAATDDEAKPTRDANALANFCVSGDYQVRCGLKSLCRASIRTSLLQALPSNPAHSDLVKNVRKLNLPNSIQQFLLFDFPICNTEADNGKRKLDELPTTSARKQQKTV